MSHCHSEKFFFKRRKMSHRHYDKISQKLLFLHSVYFSQKGGKCPKVILTSFEIRRKMSDHYADKFSQKGEKCPTVILASFGKKGGKCPTVI